MERRVSALEKNLDKMDAKLDKIIGALGDARTGAAERFGSLGEKLARIERKLDA